MRGKKTDLDDFIGQIKAQFDGLFDALKGLFEPSQEEKEIAFYKAVKAVPTLRSLFPYIGFLKDEGLFIVDDGSNGKCLGFTIEFQPQTGANEEMEKVLQQLFRMGSKGTAVQVQMFGSPNIQSFLDGQLALVKNEDQIHHDLLAYRHAFWTKLTKQSLFDGAPYMLRDYRSWISFTVPIASLESEIDKEEVINLREQVLGTLSSASLSGEVWGPAEIVDFLLDITDHRRLFIESKPKRGFDEGKYIRDHVRSGGLAQVNASDADFWWPDDNLRTRTVAMSVIDYPTSFKLSQASNMIGSYFNSMLSYPCPFLITLGSWALDKKSIMTKAALKKERTSTLMKGPMGKMLPEIANQHADWDGMIRAVDAGHVPVRMYHQILLFTPAKNTRQITQKVDSLWRSMGFSLVTDTFEFGQAFFSAMPMNLTSGMQEDLIGHGRASTKYSNNAIATSPVIAESKGTYNRPSLILFGRRGQAMAIDFYDNTAGNYNAAVAGAPGSGKSFFMNELIRIYLANGGRAWNFDSGRSFYKMNRELKGQYIEFTQDAKLNINPFTHIKDIEDELEALVFITGKMISPSGELSDYHQAALKNAIFKVFNDYGQDTTYTNLYHYLKDEWRDQDGQQDQRIKDMAAMLNPWTKYGPMANWLEGKSNIDFDNQYILLEMEELKNKGVLRDVVMAQMTLRISQEMYFDREQMKLMLMDEAWDLMAGLSGGFMEDLYRRVRKYRGSAVAGTQGLSDFYEKSDASRAAIAQSDWTCLLRQKPESVKILEKDDRLDADPFQLRTIKGLQTLRGGFNPSADTPDEAYKAGFSEIYIKSPVMNAVGRFIVDPYSLMLYSTLPEDFTAVERKLAQGMDVSGAIKSVLADRGVTL